MKLLKALGMPKFEFTWATMITLFRGLSAVGFLGWYTWNPSVWLAFWIGAMEMLDVVDGWVARRFNQGTDFGRWLDASAGANALDESDDH
jgi:phosphatidylglycerophosphate synthase